MVSTQSQLAIVIFNIILEAVWGFTGGSVVKNLPVNAENTRDSSSIPGSGRYPGEGNSNPLHYSCLENPTDKGAWQGTVHGVAKESDMTKHTHVMYA